MDINIRDWTFTHWWVRPTVKIWFEIYHKSVTYSGVENINWQNPIIFAPSHRNAFSDALCIILPTKYTEKRFIYPLIRADAFGNSKAIDWMLTVFHMMPVYRPRDNVNIIKKNKSVFSHCYNILAQKRNLLIHPEGNCIPEKRVRYFKKGMARIAFGAEKTYNFDLGVDIIPVGINYREIIEPRQGIHVRYGAPIRVSDFSDIYRKNAAAGIKELTKTVRERVQSLTVDIRSKKYYALYDELMTVHKNWNPEFYRKSVYNFEELLANQQIVQSLKKKSARKRKFAARTSEQIGMLKTLLGDHNLSINHSLRSDQTPISFIFEGLIYLILFPVFCYGWLNSIIPWFLIHKLADQVDELQFKSSARMTLGLILFPLSYFLQTLIVFLASGHGIWAILYLVSIPFCGVLALNWWENFQDWRQRLRIFKLPASVRQKLDRMIGNFFSE